MPAPQLPQHRPSERPAGWDKYWDNKVELSLHERKGTFNVYTAGSTGAVVMCLHGGGYTGLTWSLVAAQLKTKYRVIAPDLRGHGLTHTEDDLDLSRQTMSDDVVAIWQHLFGGTGAERVPTVVVGHSMGGAIAVWAAASKAIPALEGVAVIDVVEGTALAALPHMMAVVNGRPQQFGTVEEAIKWAVRSGVCKSQAAAAVSMPSQLRRQQPEDTAAGAMPPPTSQPPQPALWRLDGGTSGGGGGGGEAAAAAAAGSSGAGASGDGGHGPAAGTEGGGTSSSTAATATTAASAAAAPWVWRTQLGLTRPHWEDWYRGLSDEFLKVSAPKLLLLAGTDRLDKPLTIGQMQGKFQLVLLPAAGHAIQEDEADKTAEHLMHFLHRFRVGEPPLVFPRAPGARVVLPIVAGPTV